MGDKRIGVVSNPRSGTSLMVYLFVHCFDIKGVLPLFPHLDTNDVYEYRATPSDLLKWADNSYYTLFIMRDPRDVVVSKYPSIKDYLIDFGSWKENYNYYLRLKETSNVLDIRFEDLLSTPLSVQQDIKEFISLPQICGFDNFADCPKNTKLKRIDDLIFEMGGVRPLKKHIGPPNWKKDENRARIKEQLHKFPFMVDNLLSLGYEDSIEWASNFK